MDGEPFAVPSMWCNGDASWYLLGWSWVKACQVQQRWEAVWPLQTAMVAAAAAAALGWKQTLHAESSETGSAAGKPAGLAAPLWHTRWSKTPANDRRSNGKTTQARYSSLTLCVIGTHKYVVEQTLFQPSEMKSTSNKPNDEKNHSGINRAEKVGTSVFTYLVLAQAQRWIL